jgi:teichoic acid transport system permease protein
MADAGLPLKELGRRHGLTATGALPSLPAYARLLWTHRTFIVACADAKVSSTLGDTRLGMLWQLLIPLFNATIYYVIFGLVLDTEGGADNFVPYLCIGVFLFGFTQSVVQAGAGAISGNLGMIRALHFPRASLPLAVAVAEVRNLIASTAVLLGIVLLAGTPMSWRWLLLVPAMALLTVFTVGLAMAVARLGARLTDIRRIIPFVMRIWLYLSAVLYPVTTLGDHAQGWKLQLLEANPLLVFIELARHALLERVELAGSPGLLWTEAVCWTLVAGLGGFIYFWRGEKGYGHR